MPDHLTLAPHTLPDPGTLDRNLAALREFSPDDAAELRDCELPTGARLVSTRDGSLNFTWPAPDGGAVWLGRTSLPLARAAGLVEAFQIDGNALVVGIGPGEEVVGLLRRMPAHGCVFVIEPNVAEAAMALQRRDFAEELRFGRLVLTVGVSAWERLRRFLLHRQGYLPPLRILCWPWFTRGDVHELTTRMTALAGEVSRARAAELRRLRDSPPRAHSSVVAVISPTADESASQLVRRLAWGLGAAGRSAVAFAVDRPAHADTLACARVLHEASPGEIVLVNAGRNDMAGLIDGNARVVTWLTSSAAPTPQLREGLGSDDRLVVMHPSQRTAIEAAGVDARRIVQVTPAAWPNEGSPSRSLLVIADGGDDRPAAAGLHLASHVALWEAVREILRSRADQIWADDLESALRRAEHRCGIRMGEPDVHAGVSGRIGRVLLPAMLNRAYVEALLDDDIELYGYGWSGVPTAARVWRGHRPDGRTAFAAVVHLSIDAGLTCEWLDAVADGAAPLIRTRPGRPPQTDGILSAGDVLSFGTVGELRRAWHAVRGGRSEVGERARAHIRARHTWAQRVADVIGR